MCVCVRLAPDTMKWRVDELMELGWSLEGGATSTIKVDKKSKFDSCAETAASCPKKAVHAAGLNGLG